jgi:hypothetical protein
MATSIKRPVFITKSGQELLVTPGTENPVSVDKMIRRRNEFHARYKHLLEGYSVSEFLREKHKDAEMGIE